MSLDLWCHTVNHTTCSLKRSRDACCYETRPFFFSFFYHIPSKVFFLFGLLFQIFNHLVFMTRWVWKDQKSLWRKHDAIAEISAPLSPAGVCFPPRHVTATFLPFFSSSGDDRRRDFHTAAANWVNSRDWGERACSLKFEDVNNKT